MGTDDTPSSDDLVQKELERLDVNAKTLVTATTLTFALLTLLGVTADRLPMLLNSDSDAKSWIIAAVVLAILATLLGFAALAVTPAGTPVLFRPKKVRKFTPRTRELFYIGAGVLALMASLGSVTMAATTAFTEDGRPTISDVAVTPGESGVSMSFTIRADGVSRDTRLMAFGTWVRSSEQSPQLPPFYFSTLRPNDKGVVEQKVVLNLPASNVDRSVRLQVYRAPAESAGELKSQAARVIGASCTDQEDQKTAPACTIFVVPAAAPTPAK